MGRYFDFIVSFVAGLVTLLLVPILLQPDATWLHPAAATDVPALRSLAFFFIALLGACAARLMVSAWRN